MTQEIKNLEILYHIIQYDTRNLKLFRFAH